MQAFLYCCGGSASPFTRVGSQVQSLPRPPLNPFISKWFNGFQAHRSLSKGAERHANKREFFANACTYPVQPTRLIAANANRCH